MLKGILADRIQRAFIKADVLDISECPVSDETFAKADALAKTIRLKPLLYSHQLDQDGRFVVLPIELMMTSLSDHLEDDLYQADMDGEYFSFQHISDIQSANELASELEDRDPADRWPIRHWIESARDRDNGVLISVAKDDGAPSGFLGFRRTVTVDIMGEDDIAICYSIHPDYLYVSPDSRGQRLSSALRRAVMEDVGRDLDDIAQLWRSGRLHAAAQGEIGLQFRVAGQADSDEGELFFDSLRQNVEEQVEFTFTGDERSEFGFDEVEPAY